MFSGVSQLPRGPKVHVHAEDLEVCTRKAVVSGPGDERASTLSPRCRNQPHLYLFLYSPKSCDTVMNGRH